MGRVHALRRWSLSWTVTERRRRTAAPSVYESTDASLLELVEHGRDGAVLRRPGGTMLTFARLGGQLQCTEIKDRNGNYLSMAYDTFGHVSQVTDTLGRVFTFERDAGGNLTSIVRTAGDARTVMATFGYDDLAKSAVTFKAFGIELRGASLKDILRSKLASNRPQDQQDVIMSLGVEMEQFGTKEAIADDERISEVYAKKGAKVFDLDAATVDKWRAIARDTAWKDYAQKTPLSAELLKLAEGIQLS